MKKILVTALFSACSIGAYAQSASDGVRESTDPAKIAEVERKAQEIMNRQQSSAGQSSSGSSDAASGQRGTPEKKKDQMPKDQDHRKDNRSEKRSSDGSVAGVSAPPAEALGTVK